MSKRIHPARRARRTVGIAGATAYVGMVGVFAANAEPNDDGAVAAEDGESSLVVTAGPALGLTGGATPVDDGAAPTTGDSDALSESSIVATTASSTRVEPTETAPETAAPTAAPTTTEPAATTPSTSGDPATTTITAAPTTAPPTTAAPTTAPPTTAAPTTAPPTTAAPTTTIAPTTAAPTTTIAPTTTTQAS